MPSYVIVYNLWHAPEKCHIFCVSIRHFQNRRLGPRRPAVGAPKESPCHELWQAEPLHTAVLQEGHHPQTWCVSETGVPVRSPRMKQHWGTYRLTIVHLKHPTWGDVVGRVRWPNPVTTHFRYQERGPISRQHHVAVVSFCWLLLRITAHSK